MSSEIDQKPLERREVEFHSFADYLSDLEEVSLEEYLAMGKLSKGQIFKHLADSLVSSMDGFPDEMRGPWIVRKAIGPLLKNKILLSKMKPGIRLPKKAGNYLPDRDEFPVKESLRELLEALRRYQEEMERSEHPFIGKLSCDEWDLLHLRHAELHLSFLGKPDKKS